MIATSFITAYDLPNQFFVKIKVVFYASRYPNYLLPFITIHKFLLTHPQICDYS